MHLVGSVTGSKISCLTYQSKNAPFNEPIVIWHMKNECFRALSNLLNVFQRLATMTCFCCVYLSTGYKFSRALHLLHHVLLQVLVVISVVAFVVIGQTPLL